MQSRSPVLVRWVGKHYAHFIAPRPFLDDATAMWIDDLVQSAGWHAAGPPAGPPFLFRRWSRRMYGFDLFLVVVGWYPLLVTVGFLPTARQSPQRRESRKASNEVVSREVLLRIASAFEQLNARPVADDELVMCLDVTQRQWREAEEIRQRRELYGVLLDYRRCSECSAWSGYEASHCRACGHRFSSQEDLARTTQRDNAQKQLSRDEMRLEQMARGEGIFADWPATSTPGSTLVGVASYSSQGGR